MKFKKGDQIIITAGKDKGRKGKIEKIFPSEGRVLVPGVNMYKRHMKKRDEKRPGGILDFPRPLRLGNIALVCPKCGKPTRVGYVVAKTMPAGRQGEKVRICRKCKQKI